MNVTDVNDNSPVFYPHVYYPVIPESAGVGYSIVSVMATDADKGNNGLVEYSLNQQSNPNNLFSINVDSGVVSLAKSLSLSQRSYTLQVSQLFHVVLVNVLI